MTLSLVGVGALGNMLSPSAKHLSAGGPARFLRIHDRGTRDPRRDAGRARWQAHGAEPVADFEALVGDGAFDGVVICAGKNGDDYEILRTLAPLLKQAGGTPPFVLHLSTVSAEFVQAAHKFLVGQGLAYANYPLTGGPAGAEAAAMLILASGDPALFNRLEPFLNAIGKPRFFGPRVTAGAEVKLIGQVMVFNGLLGICSAAALKAECFGETLSGPEQAGFFDFLNNGAGGTRQWDVALSKGVRDQVWDQGFMIHHAVVDAIYAAELCRAHGLPAVSILPLITTALSFAHLLLKHGGMPLCTHAVAREMLRKESGALDAFLKQHLAFPDIAGSIKNCIGVLPAAVKASVMLDIDAASFAR